MSPPFGPSDGGGADGGGGAAGGGPDPEDGGVGGSEPGAAGGAGGPSGEGAAACPGLVESDGAVRPPGVEPLADTEWLADKLAAEPGNAPPWRAGAKPFMAFCIPVLVGPAMPAMLAVSPGCEVMVALF